MPSDCWIRVVGGRISPQNSDSSGPRSLGEIEDEKVCQYKCIRAVGKEKNLVL
jgi:hypothetical protein